MAVTDRVERHFRRSNEAVRSHDRTASRSGWNTLRIAGAIPDDERTEAIDTSYVIIVSELPRKDRPA
jgi:hypothetical protein